MYSVRCVMNPPTLRLSFKAKGFIGVGRFRSQRPNFKVRFCLRTNFPESTDYNAHVILIQK